MNALDLGILLVFAATLIFLTFYVETDEIKKDYRELIETDDVIILVIVMSRYLVQIIRLIFAIKHAKINRDIHNEMKAVNLNNVELNVSTNFNEVKADQMVRDRMTSKYVPFVEEK